MAHQKNQGVTVIAVAPFSHVLPKGRWIEMDGSDGAGGKFRAGFDPMESRPGRCWSTGQTAGHPYAGRIKPPSDRSPGTTGEGASPSSVSLPVQLTLAFGDDQVQRLPVHLLFRVAEDPFRRLVPEADDPVPIREAEPPE
jgi:hypothetical protein